MDCIKCPTPGPLVQVALQDDVTVDACRACKGIFFDEGELGTFLQLSKDVPDLDKRLADAPDTVGCPKCQQAMKELHWTRDRDLEVDYCQGCSGVWLDGGEISEARDMAQQQDLKQLRLMRHLWELRRSVRGAKSLPCPKCDDGKVEEFRLDERITLDMCQTCHGVWFEKGELAEKLELSEDIPQLDKALATAVETDLHCHACPGDPALVEMEYSEITLESGRLKIDYCKVCSGIWIDAKEMVMLEVLATQVESPAHRLGGAVKKLQAAGYVFL